MRRPNALATYMEPLLQFSIVRLELRLLPPELLALVGRIVTSLTAGGHTWHTNVNLQKPYLLQLAEAAAELLGFCHGLLNLLGGQLVTRFLR